MRLREIAHGRTGDKGDISNISVIPYNEAHYEALKKALPAERVKNYFSEICNGEVLRYELDGVHALNFVLDKALGGGVTRSLAIDKHGKTLAMALLEMELPELDGLSPAKALSPKEPPVLEKETIRIGSGAGYAGDRIDAAEKLMKYGELDYVIFECLAERTIAIGQNTKQTSPDLGYNSLLDSRMRMILPLAKEKGIKVITNMGSANPKSAAKRTAEIAKELGVYGLNIAYVTGDDIYDQIDSYKENEILENGKKLGQFEVDFVSANAYIGCEGIVEALENGADIVITGRVSDPALTIGPLVHEFGWNINDHANAMGQATLAGHLLECAGQVTGGYYADPCYKDVDELADLGFPIIEIDKNGNFTVSKIKESGGLVCVDTCKEQMIYEIHNPKAYLTPDSIADFSNVTFTQVGENVVYATGATSHGRPSSLKVNLGYLDCFVGDGEISYGGSNCIERAKLAAEIIEKRLAMLNLIPEELRIDYIGYDSLYREAITNKIASNNPTEIRLHVAARYKSEEKAIAFTNDFETLYTNGPAGGGGASKKVTKVFSVCSIFVPRDAIKQQVCYVSTLIPFPIKGVLLGFPMFGEPIKDAIPALKDRAEIEGLEPNVTFESLRSRYQLSFADFDILCNKLAEIGKAFAETTQREVAEFGVPVDLSDPCHDWSNTDLDVQLRCVHRIAEKYQGRKGEIIFYGPSNLQMWYSLEKDMLPYAAQNHGMGGCIDSEMIAHAKEMLYDFEPSVVFFQTGSNDLALGLSLEQILANKEKMYSEFMEQMPNTKLVIMSGLPLPGRQVFWEDTVKTNALLAELAAKYENLYFMDATSVLTGETGREDMKTFDNRFFLPEYYRVDGIHLNKAGHDVWTGCMKAILKEILPL